MSKAQQFIQGLKKLETETGLTIVANSYNAVYIVDINTPLPYPANILSTISTKAVTGVREVTR